LDAGHPASGVNIPRRNTEQIWFEPDIGSAADALRDCASNAEKREQFVIAAKQTIDRYSTKNCGREYLKLLKSRASK
jgi:glycosyltransferase involved in cell wall biosynthesis